MMTGRGLTAALVTIAVLTFVLPPVVARQVGARRIARARAEVAAIARELTVGAWSRSGDGGDAVLAPRILTGHGNPPRFAEGLVWRGMTASPAPGLFGDRVDPWGNQYVVVFAGDAASVRIVLSAGPNGTIETARAQIGEPVGDDILVVSHR